MFAVEMVRTRSLDRRIVLSPPVNASIRDDDCKSIYASNGNFIHPAYVSSSQDTSK